MFQLPFPDNNEEVDGYITLDDNNHDEEDEEEEEEDSADGGDPSVLALSLDSGSTDDSSTSTATGLQVLTLDEMLENGLLCAGFAQERLDSVCKQTNLKRFKELFGITPALCLVGSTAGNYSGASKDRSKGLFKKFFFMTLFYFKHYPTEIIQELTFGFSKFWSRKMLWFYIKKIAALKEEKIVWPADNFGTDTWVISVDGTHCATNEPRTGPTTIDRSVYSHKKGRAGLAYEIGISLTESKVVWLNGPFKAGKNDITIFCEGGLKDKLAATGKVAIGDRGYRGHPAQVTVPNLMNRKSVRIFKTRAQCRHETFNGLLKNFHVLDTRYRNSRACFKLTFEAIAV
eukprot:Nitzschia sp. Nitz4//scaffold798_size1094//38//1071//NITZ4_009331-RA/size1094-snap-gene-0.0-mRNA-1//1//CDS//3329558184//5894//frame0